MNDQVDDIEEEAEVDDTPEIHTLFSDWLRPTDLQINRASLRLRWKTIARLREELEEEEDLRNLVQLSLGVEIPDDGPENWLRKEFKKDDEFFPMQATANLSEMKNLASSCLAVFLDDENTERKIKVATYILASSFCESREFFGGADLIEISKVVLRQEGLKCRGRIRPRSPSFSFSVRSATQKAIDGVVHGQPDTFTTALNSVLSEVRSHLSATSRNMTSYVREATKLSRVQDEELEILWWLFSGKSSIKNQSFDGIDAYQSPVVFGTEFARRTNMGVELPALQSLLVKTGMENEASVEFKAVVNSCKNIAESILEEDEYCPFITPVLHALSCIRENSRWQKLWEANSGLSGKTIASASDWATQVYRETLTYKL